MDKRDRRKRKRKRIIDNEEATIIIPLIREEDIDFEHLEEWDIEDYDIPNVRMKMFKSALKLAKKRKTHYII